MITAISIFIIYLGIKDWGKKRMGKSIAWKRHLNLIHAPKIGLLLVHPAEYYYD